MQRLRQVWLKWNLDRNYGKVRQAVVVIDAAIRTAEEKAKLSDKELYRSQRAAFEMRNKPKEQQLRAMRELRTEKKRNQRKHLRLHLLKHMKDNAEDLWDNANMLYTVQNVGMLLGGLSTGIASTLDKAYSKMDNINEDLIQLTNSFEDNEATSLETADSAGPVTDDDLESEFNDLVREMSDNVTGASDSAFMTEEEPRGRAREKDTLFSRLEALSLHEDDGTSGGPSFPGASEQAIPLLVRPRATRPAANARMASLGLGTPARPSVSTSSTSSFAMRAALPSGVPSSEEPRTLIALEQ